MDLWDTLQTIHPESAALDIALSAGAIVVVVTTAALWWLSRRRPTSPTGPGLLPDILRGVRLLAGGGALLFTLVGAFVSVAHYHDELSDAVAEHLRTAYDLTVIDNVQIDDNTATATAVTDAGALVTATVTWVDADASPRHPGDTLPETFDRLTITFSPDLTGPTGSPLMPSGAGAQAP